MKLLRLIMMLVVTLPAIAQTADPTPLTAEEQAFVDAAVLIYRQQKTVANKNMATMDGNVKQLVVDVGNQFTAISELNVKVEAAQRELEAIKINAPQWVQSAKDAAARAKAAEETSAAIAQSVVTFDNRLKAVEDKYIALTERLAKVETALADLVKPPAPATKTVLAWRATATGSWALLNGATIPTTVNIRTLTPTFAEPTNVKSVIYYLGNNTSGFSELTAPFDYRGGSATFPVGSTSLKQIVTFVDGTTETITASFTIR